MGFLQPRTPLPPNVRLFNRILLLVLLGAAFYQCGRLWLAETPDPDVAGPASPADSIGDSVALHEDGDTDVPVVAEPEQPAKEGLPAHIAAQKDPGLAGRIDALLRAYRPDHALVLLVDAQTNEILAWGQRTDSAISTEPTFLKRSTFPAASLIKMVTGAAALETRRYALDSELPLIGANHTLYKRQLYPPANHHGNTITVADAFARSSNPGMGQIGIALGGRALGSVGYKMGFNRQYPGDVPHMSVFIPPDTGYALAEAASGFTKANTISPLHTAALVRALLKRKPMEIPWSQHMPADTFTVNSPAPISGTQLSQNTYYGMRQMMLRTVTHGTSQRAMNKVLFSYNKSGLSIGGKTGSLDGTDPPGRYDWFAGFAEYKKDASQSLILVVMQVHGKYRSQSSSTVAAQIINYWAKYNLKNKP